MRQICAAFGARLRSSSRASKRARKELNLSLKTRTNYSILALLRVAKKTRRRRRSSANLQRRTSEKFNLVASAAFALICVAQVCAASRATKQQFALALFVGCAISEHSKSEANKRSSQARKKEWKKETTRKTQKTSNAQKLALLKSRAFCACEAFSVCQPAFRVCLCARNKLCNSPKLRTNATS